MMIADAVLINGTLYNVKAGMNILVTVSNDLTIVVPATDKDYTKYIDIPLVNITKAETALGKQGFLKAPRASATSGTLTIQLEEQIDQAYYMNESGCRPCEVNISFESAEDAAFTKLILNKAISASKGTTRSHRRSTAPASVGHISRIIASTLLDVSAVSSANGESAERTNQSEDQAQVPSADLVTAALQANPVLQSTNGEGKALRASTSNITSDDNDLNQNDPRQSELGYFSANDLIELSPRIREEISATEEERTCNGPGPLIGQKKSLRMNNKATDIDDPPIGSENGHANMVGNRYLNKDGVSYNDDEDLYSATPLNQSPAFKKNNYHNTSGSPRAAPAGEVYVRSTNSSEAKSMDFGRATSVANNEASTPSMGSKHTGEFNIKLARLSRIRHIGDSESSDVENINEGSNMTVSAFREHGQEKTVSDEKTSNMLKRKSRTENGNATKKAILGTKNSKVSKPQKVKKPVAVSKGRSGKRTILEQKVKAAVDLNLIRHDEFDLPVSPKKAITAKDKPGNKDIEKKPPKGRPKKLTQSKTTVAKKQGKLKTSVSHQLITKRTSKTVRDTEWNQNSQAEDSVDEVLKKHEPETKDAVLRTVSSGRITKAKGSTAGKNATLTDRRQSRVGSRPVRSQRAAAQTAKTRIRGLAESSDSDEVTREDIQTSNEPGSPPSISLSSLHEVEVRSTDPGRASSESHIPQDQYDSGKRLMKTSQQAVNLISDFSHLNKALSPAAITEGTEFIQSVPKVQYSNQPQDVIAVAGGQARNNIYLDQASPKETQIQIPRSPLTELRSNYVTSIKFNDDTAETNATTHISESNPIPEMMGPEGENLYENDGADNPPTFEDSYFQDAIASIAPQENDTKILQKEMEEARINPAIVAAHETEMKTHKQEPAPQALMNTGDINSINPNLEAIPNADKNQYLPTYVPKNPADPGYKPDTPIDPTTKDLAVSSGSLRYHVEPPRRTQAISKNPIEKGGVYKILKKPSLSKSTSKNATVKFADKVAKALSSVPKITTPEVSSRGVHQKPIRDAADVPKLHRDERRLIESEETPTITLDDRVDRVRSNDLAKITQKAIARPDGQRSSGFLAKSRSIKNTRPKTAVKTGREHVKPFTPKNLVQQGENFAALTAQTFGDHSIQIRIQDEDDVKSNDLTPENSRPLEPLSNPKLRAGMKRSLAQKPESVAKRRILQLPVDFGVATHPTIPKAVKHKDPDRIPRVIGFSAKGPKNQGVSPSRLELNDYVRDGTIPDSPGKREFSHKRKREDEDKTEKASYNVTAQSEEHNVFKKPRVEDAPMYMAAVAKAKAEHRRDDPRTPPIRRKISLPDHGSPLMQDPRQRLSSQSSKVDENGSPLPNKQAESVRIPANDTIRHQSIGASDFGNSDPAWICGNDETIFVQQDSTMAIPNLVKKNKDESKGKAQRDIHFISSNSSKKRPSSPDAPSTLMSAFHYRTTGDGDDYSIVENNNNFGPSHALDPFVVPGGDYISIENNDVLVPSFPPDPFNEPNVGKSNGFLEALRRLNGEHGKYGQTNRRQEQQHENNLDRGHDKTRPRAREVADPDRTLVAGLDTENDNWGIQSSHTSASSETSTSREDTHSDKSSGRENPFNEKWRNALQPHQGDMLGILYEISHVGRRAGLVRQVAYTTESVL